VMDQTDYDDIRATSLSAIQQFGNQESVSNDTQLMKSVGRMRKAAAPKYKKTAKQFLEKYGR